MVETVTTVRWQLPDCAASVATSAGTRVPVLVNDLPTPLAPDRPSGSSATPTRAGAAAPLNSARAAVAAARAASLARAKGGYRLPHRDGDQGAPVAVQHT